MDFDSSSNSDADAAFSSGDPFVRPKDGLHSMRDGWRVFGDYVLLSRIGEGASGVVYQARQTSLNRPVAVKISRAAAASDPMLRERMRREAEASARLRHPNIVPVLEVGESDGQWFLAMTLMPGGSLADRIKDGSADPRVIAGHLLKIARATQHAHERGFIHRDIKPANILLDEQGEPHLSDFGVARLQGNPSELTAHGQLIGTPGYLAPEVIRHGAIEATTSADIYSLGATLYHLLTGRLPFSKPDLQALFRAVLEEAPPPPSSVARSGIPADLDAICLKCLEKDSDARYPSAADLAADLDRFLRGEPVIARPRPFGERLVSWAHRHPIRAGGLSALAVALVAVAGSTAWGWRQAELRSQEALMAASTLRAETATKERRLADELLRSGNSAAGLARLAKVLRRNPSDPIAKSRAVSVMEMRPWIFPATLPMAHGGILEAAEFSADGTEILTASRDGTVRTWSAAGGQSTGPTLHHGESIRWTRYHNRTNRSILSASTRTIRLWSAGNTNPVASLTLPFDGATFEAANDQHSLLVVGEDGSVALVSLPSLQFVRIRKAGAVAALLDRDGSSALFVNREGILQRWNAATDSIQPLTSTPALPVRTLLAPADRSWVAGVGPHRSLFRYDGSSNVWTEAPFQIGSAFTAGAVSPDGRQITLAEVAFRMQIQDVPTGLSSVASIPLRHRITRIEYDPSGLRVALGYFDGNVEIRDATQGTLLTEPMAHPNRIRAIRFSPDGRKLLTACSDGKARLWNISGPRHLPLIHPIEGIVDAVHYSPDGRHLAATSESGTLHLWDANEPEANPLRLNLRGICTPLIWTTDSRSLIGIVDGRRIVCITIDRSSTNVARIAWERPVKSGNKYDPDNGLRIASSALDLGATLGVCGCDDGSLEVFSLSDGRAICSLSTRKSHILAVAIDPSESAVAMGDEEGFVQQWDLKQKALQHELPRHDFLITGLAFGSDGRTAASFGGDGLLQVWSTLDGRVLQRQAHTDGINTAVRSPHAPQWFSGTFDHQARVWNSTDGTPAGPWFLPGREVSGGVFLDTDRLCVATIDNSSQIWSGSFGEAMTEPFPYPEAARAVSYSARSKTIAVAGMCDRIDLWENVQIEGPAPGWFLDLAEGIAGFALDSADNETPVSPEEFFHLCDRIQSMGTETDWIRWAHWLLARRQRTISLNRSTPMETVLVRLTEPTSEYRIRLAILAGLEDPDAYRSLAKAVRIESKQTKPWFEAQARALERRALDLDQLRK